MATNKIILFEYDIPLDLRNMLNYEAGVWFWTLTPSVLALTDDYGNQGFYDWNNEQIYNVSSFRYRDISLAQTFSISDCKLTDNSFYYDTDTTKVYIHLEDFEPVLSNDLVIGVAVGYSYKTNTSNYYNNQYYEPRVTSIFNLKKSIDPLFYGLLKYQSGSVKFANNDGEFDDWRTRNLFAMSSRIKVGDVGDGYQDFDDVYTGFIENDKRTWAEFDLTIQDPRKGLTQGVSTNLLSTLDYPFLNDNNNDQAKPVAYGKILNAPSYCLNEEETSPSEYTFLFADTSNNFVGSIQEVRVNGVAKTPASTNLILGTFNLTSGDVGGDFDEVKIDFTVDIKNGVEILKDLMLNYDTKPFLDSFFDVDEMNLAASSARDTSLYIDDSSVKLSDAIESVANDCDIRFFVKDNGLYTARLYDENRNPDYTILKDDWIDDPAIVNNGSQYLTSVRIGYNHNIDEDTRVYYENVDFRDVAFDRYKQYKTETFDTELTTLADAIDKSETIMELSSEIDDIIERTTNWSYVNIEPTDFIIANPTDRISSTSGNFGIYEVLGVTKNLENFTIKLSMRFVKPYTIPTIEVNSFWDESNIYFNDEDNNNWIEEIIT
jgi:hypothetical protein